MNAQLGIIYNPNDNTVTTEGAVLERRYDSAMQIIEVTDASATLYDANGTVIFSGTTSGGGIVIDNNKLTTVWDTTALNALSTPKSNLKIIWNVDGTIINRWYDSVYWKMENPISEYDLIAEKSELDKYRPEKMCTVTTTTSNTEYICNQLSEPFDYWIGAIFQANTRFEPRSEKRVTDWDPTTKTLTIESAFDNTLRPSDNFTLRRSYNPEIIASWQSIRDMLASWVPKFNAGTAWTCVSTPKNVPVDGFDFKQIHLCQAMLYVARSLRLRIGDLFDLWDAEYSVRFTKALGELRAKIDINNDGKPDIIRSGAVWMSH